MGKDEKSARGSLYLIYHSSCYLSFCNFSMGVRVRGEEPKRRCSAHLMPYLLPSVCAPVYSVCIFELDSEKEYSNMKIRGARGLGIRKEEREGET